MKGILGSLGLLICLSTIGEAAPFYYTYNLAALGLANADANLQPTDPGWYGFHGGQNLQQGNFSVNLAAKTTDPQLVSNPLLTSVPFSIGQSGQTLESWSAAQFPTNNPSVGISTDVANAKVVFLMMNTFWGSPSASASIVLSFDNGAQQTFTLYGDQDLRDHNNAPWRAQLQGMFPPFYWTTQINSNLHNSKATFNESTCYYSENPNAVGCASGPGGQVNGVSPDWLGHRDVVALFIDPAYTGRTLTNVLITDLGRFPDDPNSPNRNLDGSKLWFWGMTVGGDFNVQQVPEPATYLMLAGGLGLFSLIRRKKA